MDGLSCFAGGPSSSLRPNESYTSAGITFPEVPGQGRGTSFGGCTQKFDNVEYKWTCLHHLMQLVPQSSSQSDN
jgi:hypothetical protein